MKHGLISFHQTQCVNSMEDIRKGLSHGQTLNVTWCSLLFTTLRLQQHGLSSFEGGTSGGRRLTATSEAMSGQLGH
jgi:hypothetical protein